MPSNERRINDLNDRISASCVLCVRSLFLSRRTVVPCLLSDAAFTQLVLLHLAVLGRWQLAHEFEVTRDCKVRKTRCAIGNQLPGQKRSAGMENQRGHDFILRQRRAYGKHRGVRDGGMTDQDLLDLERRDVLTSSA